MAAAAAPGGAAAGAPVGALLPHLRRASSRRVGTREAKPLIPTSIYAITKRDHEELCLVDRGRLRHPVGGAALLQRLRPRPGALQPLHRRGRDLRLAAAQRPARRSSSRTASSRATSSTSATSCAAIMLALESERADGHAINLGTGRPSTVLEVAARAVAPGWRSRSSRSRNGQYRAGDIRHCCRRPDARARAARLRGRRRRSRRGCAACWLARADQERRSTASTTPPASWPHADWRAESGMLRWRRRGARLRRADLAIVVVSTNEVHWLERCLSTVFEHAGDGHARSDRRRQRLDRRHPRAGRVEVPAGARRQLAQPRLRVRQQPRAGTAPTRATCCCSTPTPK